jgi:NTE family protein
VGALEVLEQHGYYPKNMAGTSAGAIVSTLYAAGYTAPQLRLIIESEDFKSFMDATWEDHIPLVGSPLSVVLELGMHRGEIFRHAMDQWLRAKGVTTFKDLVHPEFKDNPDPRYRYKVQIIASDITHHEMLVLPRDAHKLGVDPDDLNVSLAVRMSMSIPIFFEPVRFRNAQSGKEHVVVDGGLLSNFPLWLFDSEGAPEWPTIGLGLVEGDPTLNLADRLHLHPHDNSHLPMVLQFLKGLLLTMNQAHDRMYIDEGNFTRTIPIPTLGIDSTAFSISHENSQRLYHSGRIAAENFLASWDFQTYIQRFRSGLAPERNTRRVAEQAMNLSNLNVPG